MREEIGSTAAFREDSLQGSEEVIGALFQRNRYVFFADTSCAADVQSWVVVIAAWGASVETSNIDVTFESLAGAAKVAGGNLGSGTE